MLFIETTDEYIIIIRSTYAEVAVAVVVIVWW